MFPIDKILAPLSLSPHSTSVAEYAQDLAKHFGATLELVHVLEVGIGSPADGAKVLGLQQFEQLAADAERRLDEARCSALAGGAPRVETRLLTGTLDVEILRVAIEDTPDLIVVGTHDNGEHERTRDGSLSERIVRHSSCSVLTVRRPKS